ncbi:glycosyltransferase [Patescibacteria group bacterium]
MTPIDNTLVYIFLFISLYFEVFFLITFLEYKSRPVIKAVLPKKLPSVTIMVPCWDEERTAAKTIKSLLALDYPKNKLKIFAIDDGSTDGTWSILKRFEKNPQVQIFQKENGGKHTALNHGLDFIDTDLVGCLDADSFVAPNALKEIVSCFAEDEKIMAVVPAIVIHNPQTLMQLIQKAEYFLSVFIRKTASLLDALFVTPGPFSIFRTNIIKEMEGYRHGHQTEDLEMALRLQKHHYKIGNCPSAFVYTIGPRTLRDLYKQRVRWTHGFLENAKDYKELFFSRTYGNLSLLMLPVALISIFAALYLAIIFLFSIIRYAITKIAELSIVGISMPVSSSFIPDFFFIKTDSMIFVSIALIILTATLVLFGKRLVGEKLTITRDVVYYLFLYGFIAPFWLAKSVYDTMLAKKGDWR